MAHTPEVPTATPIDFNITEIDAFYVADGTADPLALTEADLIPLTSGEGNFAPTRSVSRQALHSGKDIVTPGSLQGGDASIDVYLDPLNEKMALFRDSLRNKKPIIWNRFYRDGTGYAGWAYVTGIVPNGNPEATFSQTINVSTFNVNDIEPPAPSREPQPPPRVGAYFAMTPFHDLLTLTGRDGTPLHLLAALETPVGLEAEGYVTQAKLRAGRVFTSPTGVTYRLPVGLKPAVTWNEPVTLDRRNS